jgi:hypothetical protein
MFIFIETKLFSRLADEHLSDDGLSKLQAYLNENAEAGDIIRGSGGVRKLRWAAEGRAWRITNHLLLALETRRNLAAHVIRKE